MLNALKRHSPEYAIEATGLAVLASTVCSFAVLLFHPDSHVVRAIPSVLMRHALMGVIVGGTSVSLVYSRWGKRSGAHFNPAVTLTYWCLGKVSPHDAAWYVVAQLAGAAAGVVAMAVAWRRWLAHPEIHYAASRPGEWGPLITWIVELLLAFVLMTIILTATNTPRFARWTGLFTAALTIINVAVIVPLIGTSLNPARSLASAIPAHTWTNLWLYWTAGPLGMVAAAFVYVQRHGVESVFCAKLHHQNAERCIFCESRRERLRETRCDACNPIESVASKGQKISIASQVFTNHLESPPCQHSATTMSLSSARVLAAARSPTSSLPRASESY